MTETFTCTCCRGEHPLAERTEFNGQALCPDCLAERTILCRDCGRRIWADDNEGSEDHPLCQHCYERRYTNCDRCGALLRTHQALYMYGDDDRGARLLRHLLPPGERPVSTITATSPCLSSTGTAPGTWVWSWRSTRPVSRDARPGGSARPPTRTTSTSTSSMTAPWRTAWRSSPTP